MESDAVRKIGFTGSTRVGKLLFAAAADTVKKVQTVTTSGTILPLARLSIGSACWYGHGKLCDMQPATV